jgi:acetyl-CoA carboxylase carboxyl transferase subunit alpha
LDILPHEKPIYEYLKTIEHLKKQSENNPLFKSEVRKLEQKLEVLKEQVYSQLTPWQRVMICRHPNRPHALDYIKGMSEQFTELCGDRTYGDDHSIVGGIATIGGVKFVVIGQEKGNDTESRIYHNFGSVNPEGFRKALRLMQMAEKFNLPILSLVDTSGAYPGLGAEQRGQGWAIATNLREMARIATPIIVIIIGEGCSGGALGIAVGDVIGMLEHAYYTVISPEGCASILWKDSGKSVEAASALKINAENLMELNIIDAIIKEPLGGAHHAPAQAIESVKQFTLENWQVLKRIPPELILEQRYLKFRAMGRVAERGVGG